MLTFKKLEESDLELVLNWRTSEHVTKFMYTDIKKNMEQQRKWFDRITNDPSQFYWIIQYKNLPIGLISLNQIDRTHHKATFGYYIGDLNYSIIAGRIQPYLYNYAFFELGLNKLYAEVMEGNNGMMKMHLHYGFTHSATFREHIYKYGKYHDVEYFEILSSTWRNKCGKFHKYKAEFPI